jgi:ribosomal protein L19E
MPRAKKQKRIPTTLKEIGEMLAYLVANVAMRDEVATRDEVREIVREATEPLANKIDGINRRLDTEAMHRTDLKIPRRVHELEESVYGPGNSKHPKHVPL